jgi:hypothetical protein
MCDKEPFIEINYIFIYKKEDYLNNPVPYLKTQMSEITYIQVNSLLLDEEDHGAIIYRLYENRIFHAIIKPREKVTLELTAKGYDFLNKHGGGKFYNIYEFYPYAEMDSEVRSWASHDSGNHYTHVDAIVISQFPQKMIANFYLKFHKPKSPTKIFQTKEKALEWILSILEKDQLG